MHPFDQAQLMRPPHGFGSGDATAWKSAAIGAVSATYDLVGQPDRIVAVVLRPTVDCYVRFGPSGLGAALTTDMPLSAGWIYRFTLIGDKDRYCSVLRAGSTDGALGYYLPSLPAPSMLFNSVTQGDEFPPDELPA